MDTIIFNTDNFHCKTMNEKGEEFITKVTLSRKIEITKEGAIEMLEKELNTKVLDVVDGNKAHFCSCGDISESPDTNVLCKECQMLYGHTFESDL